MYQTKVKPWLHQEQIAQKIDGKRAFALLCAMRTGKTKMLLDDFGRLEDRAEVDDLLVIAPAGVYHTWLTAIDDHVGGSLASRLSVHLWEASAGRQAERDLEEFMAIRHRPRILLVNVEALSSVIRARVLCKDFLKQRASMLAIDESTTIKNPTARRTKFILNELKYVTAYRRILTGLVSPKNPLDLWAQFQFLDRRILGYDKFTAFRARYAITKQVDFGGRYPATIVVGFRPDDVETLHRLIEPHSFRVRLEDCYDLPPKMYQFRDVELTDEQRKVYQKIKDDACARLSDEDHVSANQVITQILRMHQVLLGHVGLEDGRTATLPERRTDELMALLDEHDGGKAVIWVSYDDDVVKLTARLRLEHGEASVARFWGGNREEREEEERRFREEEGCRFMIATASAGGRGRKWDVADLVVYYSNTPDLEHRSQSEERTQGIGKVRSVLYVDMRVPGTVEDKIIATLRKKITMASVINGDNYQSWLI